MKHEIVIVARRALDFLVAPKPGCGESQFIRRVSAKDTTMKTPLTIFLQNHYSFHISANSWFDRQSRSFVLAEERH